MPIELSPDNELTLHGPVGYDFWAESGFDALMVRAALMGAAGPITVYLNSGGGVAFEGAAIHAVLSSYPDKVTVVIEGVAASAASLLAMAGDEIVMAEAAMMMIHDPSGLTWGTAEDHRQTGAMLDTLAEEYAAAYARRAGISAAEARAVMKAELWMGGKEAVERGFADRMAGESQAATASAFPYHEYGAAPEPLVAMARANSWRREDLRAVRATRKVAATMEADMPAETKARRESVGETTAAVTAEAQAAVPPQAKPEAANPAKPEAAAPAQRAPEASQPDAAEARKAERGRIAAIREAGVALSVSDERITAAIDGEMSADAFRAEAITAFAARGQDAVAGIGGARATVTSDAGERRVDAMIGALRHTVFGASLEGPATEYRGLTMKQLAIDLSGLSRHGHTDHEKVKAGMGARGVLMSGGMHSTSDFSYVTSELMNRELRAAYGTRPGTWRGISRARTATDFRALYSAQAGGDFELRKVNEHGEYKGTVLTDVGESFRVARYGREVLLTFEAVINDDLGAFARLPSEFARGALNLESRIAWGLINANAAMADGKALFSSDHGNLAGAGAAISVTTVGAARKAMFEQRPLGAATKSTGKGDDFITAIPDLLFVPPAIETAARQFTAAITPAKGADVNPYSDTLTVVVDPRLGAVMDGGSDTAWYLFDSTLPVIEHAMLAGYEAPSVESTDKSNPKGVEIVAEHIFGAGVVEYRGGYKNGGA